MLVLIGVLAVLAAAVPVIAAAFAILTAVFSGVAVLLVAGVFAGKGIIPGIVLGLIAYRAFRKTRIAE